MIFRCQQLCTLVRLLSIEMKLISLSFSIATRKVDVYSIIQVTDNNQLTSSYRSQPGWGDDKATFQMTIAANNLHGDYQLANGYGPAQAKAVLTVSFIISEPCHLVWVCSAEFYPMQAFAYYLIC